MQQKQKVTLTGIYVICLTWSPRRIPMLPNITMRTLQRGSTLTITG